MKHYKRILILFIAFLCFGTLFTSKGIVNQAAEIDIENDYVRIYEDKDGYDGQNANAKYVGQFLVISYGQNIPDGYNFAMVVRNQANEIVAIKPLVSKLGYYGSSNVGNFNDPLDIDLSKGNRYFIDLYAEKQVVNNFGSIKVPDVMRNSNMISSWLDAMGGVFGDGSTVHFASLYNFDNFEYFSNYDATLAEHVQLCDEEIIPVREGYQFTGWELQLPDKSWVKIDLKNDRLEVYDKHEYQYLRATWIENALVNYTVSFDSGTDLTIDDVSVNHGALVTAPEDPVRNGYQFNGWYLEQSFTTLFDFTTPITSDITLYAQWEPVPVTQYTVAFDTNSETIIDSLQVNEGEKVTRPNDPLKDGYNFAGWFSDSTLLNAYNFDNEVNVDFTLYAKWTENTKNSYQINFVTNSSLILEPIVVEHGDYLHLPIQPVREGYNFGGWYLDQELIHKFDFTKPITSNTTIYLQWIENEQEVKPINIVIQYVDVNGNDILDSETFIGIYGETYQYSPKEITGYTYQSILTDSDPAQGEIENKDLKITFVYQSNLTLPNTGVGNSNMIWLVMITIGSALVLTSFVLRKKKLN